ncbi:MAG: transglutaminase domain-containing protein [Eubacteriales bacterium]|nr:transglutaminase domain-containing protein [Eubacteriales bacterium]
MKKIKVFLMAVLMALAVQICAVSVSCEVQAATATTTAAKKKTGLYKEKGLYYYYVNGKKIKSQWKTVNGKRYYFGSKYHAVRYHNRINGKFYVFDTSGRLLTGKKSRIVSVGKYTYYVNKYGNPSTSGWLYLGDKNLYYADYWGRFYKSRTYEGITFNSKGQAVKNDNRTLKLKCMDIVGRITNTRMSKSQKLRACWNYVVNNTYYSSRYYPNLNQNGWWRTTALRTLGTGGGNCYGYACAFAALAREIGYDPYVVCGRVPGTRDGAWDGYTRHSWVIINGYHYDPEGQAAGWHTGVYGTYGYGMAHQIQKKVNFRTGSGN